MAWIILGIAVITEIAWALSMKWAATQATWSAASIPLQDRRRGVFALACLQISPICHAIGSWVRTGCRWRSRPRRHVPARGTHACRQSQGYLVLACADVAGDRRACVDPEFGPGLRRLCRHRDADLLWLRPPVLHCAHGEVVRACPPVDRRDACHRIRWRRASPRVWPIIDKDNST